MSCASRVFLSLTLALAVSACGIDRERLAPTAPPGKGDVLVPDASGAPLEPISSRPATGATLPDSLRCVSAPLDDGLSSAGTEVLRLDIGRNEDGTFTAWTTRGPQFWSHAGRWFGEDGAPFPEATTRVLEDSGKGQLVERGNASAVLTVSLVRDGAVLVGSLVDDQCYARTEASLTCWNDLELFGSAWAGVAGALDAHFDWSTGECKNAAGEPARNEVPLAIVQETGFAECTSLRGRLNGDDFSEPDLVGWNLAGADLKDAELFFANLTFATLNGADLGGLEFGYAKVSGSFDATTVRPESGACSELESPWGGATLECVQ